MLDLDAPPRSPAIAAALGAVRRSLATLAPPRHLLVACSGGRDSMTALGLLALLRRSEGLELTVGHVDHGLRPESAAEAELVASVAAGLGLAHRSTRLALATGAGLPARARAARRAALEDQRRACGASAIVLAHTATDQAETILMHMTRGAGLEGLAAMRSFEGRWLRPLLDLTRAETTELVGLLDLPHVDDPTNADRGALRIWLRDLALPRLRQVNPRVELAMLALARQAGEAEAALDGWAREVARARQTGGEGIDVRGRDRAWSLDGFHALPRAVRTRALRHMCEQSGVDLAHLRRSIIDAMDAAAVEVARARDGGSGTPSPAPRSFDLHPRRTIRIDKNGILADFEQD